MPDVQDTLDPSIVAAIRAEWLAMKRRWLARVEDKFAAMETIALSDLGLLIGILGELRVPTKELTRAILDSRESAQLTSEQVLKWCEAELGNDVSLENIDAEFPQDTRRHLVTRLLAAGTASVLN